MPFTIKFLESPPLHQRTASWDPNRTSSIYYDGAVDFAKMKVGEMCYYHHQGVPCKDRAHLDRLHLTSHYFQFNAGRPPLILAMPDHACQNRPEAPRYFLVDGQCYSNKCTKCGQSSHMNTCAVQGGECVPRGYYDGWTVSGAPPTITVAPSVDFDSEGVKHYHGFVQNGIIGDG